jgi:hypothetical protein
VGVDEVPLSAEDRAILALECDTIVGHTCKVIRVGPGAPDIAALRDSIAARIDRAPPLTRRLDDAGAGTSWVPDRAFEVRNHVSELRPDRPLDAAGLSAAVAALFAQRLDRERPLWQLDVARLDDGGAAMIWRIHHAIADGTTCVRLAHALLWDPTEAATAPAPHEHGAGRADDEARRRAHLARFVKREFARSRGSSPFDGRIGRRREVGFATASMRELHDAAKRLGHATLNDAVLAVVAGALRRWLESAHGELRDLRVKVPVSLHHEGDDAGNRDSFFALSLPIAERDPAARLRAIQAQTAVRKAEHDAEEMDELLRELGRASPRLERFAEQVERGPRRFALNVSNVPGPRSRVSVLGASVSGMHSLAEVGERHALRVAVISYGGDLCFGFCADPGIVHHLDVLVAGTELEAAALVAAG